MVVNTEKYDGIFSMYDQVFEHFVSKCHLFVVSIKIVSHYW